MVPAGDHSANSMAERAIKTIRQMLGEMFTGRTFSILQLQTFVYFVCNTINGIPFALHKAGVGNLLKPLVTIQKKAIRNICNTSYNSHTEMLFKKTQILKINDQIEYCTLTFCHSIFHRKAPINNLDLYSVHTNDRPLREDRLDFNINLRIYSLPKYYHPRSWNKISNSLKAETTTKVFKSNLKALLIESYANTPNCTPPCYICKT